MCRGNTMRTIRQSPTETRRSKAWHIVCLLLSECVEQYLWFVAWNEAVCESLIMDLSMEQRLVIKFCFKAGKSATETQNGKCSLWGPSTILFECFPMVWTITWLMRRQWRRPQEWLAYRVSQWQQSREDFSVVASKLSPFAKNASRQGEQWQGHSEKYCSWRFAKTEDLFTLCSTLFDSRAERPENCSLTRFDCHSRQRSWLL